MKKTHAWICGIIIGVLIPAAGGCQPYAAKKQAMESQWQRSTAQAKIPEVEDLIRRGKLNEAKQTLNKCLAAAPDMPRVHLLIGRIHFIEGRTEQARQAFARAVELDRQLDPGWYALGSLEVMEKDYEQAMEHFQEALQLQPGKTDYIISVCDLYVETERIDEAQRLLDESLARQPAALDLMLEIARLHQRCARPQEAVRVYEQAQLLHGDKPEILEPAGYVYMTLSQWDQAADKFERVLEHQQDPEHYHITLRSLALCLFNAQNYGRALACYDKLSVAFREDPEIWMGMAQSALGIEDTARAVYCARRVLQLKPGWPEGYAVLGSALYLEGDYEAAITAFDQITADPEQAAFAWFMTGRCYRLLRRPVEAETAFKQAEELDPDNELIRMFMKKTLKFL